MQNNTPWFNRILTSWLILLTPLAAQAEENHPRLFINQERINQIQWAIQVPQSHHQQAFLALKSRVEQQDWRVYDSDLNDGNWNYARSYLAKEAAFLYLLTNNREYAQVAYKAIEAIYNEPDSDNRLPDKGYGLSRATIGRNIALAYDWAYHGITPQQREYIKEKINIALDAWPLYQHVNLRNPLMASNWVAVCRGGELVMMLAIYGEAKRSNRYRQLKEWLKTHLSNGYGELGLSQEGIGYTGYGGIFLLPAVYALRSIGDTELDSYFQNIDFWKLIMYAGSFFMDEKTEREFLQSGVSHSDIIDEGWASLLLASVSPSQLPFYRYFYDYHMGVHAPGTPDVKFDERRGATVWSLIYYPESTPSFDPTGIYPQAISDQKRGAYFFRNRWKDENDILLSIMADIEHHGNAWDQSEAFQLGLLAYQTRFIGGPATERKPAVYSSLLVDGFADVPGKKTGQQKLFASFSDGGYAIIDGGEKYAGLGLSNVQRHLLVKFNQNTSTAIISTLDKIKDDETHYFTWQLNLGDQKNDGGIISTVSRENNLNIFVLRGKNNSYLKGWIIHQNPVTVGSGDPLQVQVSGSNTNIWIVMMLGQGIPPVATVEGTGMETKLKIDNTVIGYNSQSDRLTISNLVD
ncbi:MAG: hypothetical protein QNJ32_28970 [Xenococcaceae cyanobacterium MO_167.B27]|nr:hypothetical protein [Xenococcaceae cyanobacterium MO_167.B27]